MTGLTIAEAADRAGLSVDTLRYYERDGLLLRPVGRSATGHRAIERKIGSYEDAVAPLDLERAPGA